MTGRPVDVADFAPHADLTMQTAPTALTPSRSPLPTRRDHAPRPDTKRSRELALVRLAQGDSAERATRDAQAALLEADKGLLVRLVRLYRDRGVEESDLFQAACMGYLEGVRRYDLASGYAVATYALWWARLEVQECIADNAAAYVPRTTCLRLFKATRDPATSEPRKLLMRLLRPKSLDAALPSPDGDGRVVTVGDLLRCRRPLPDAVAEETSEAERQGALLDGALATLTPRELDIVRRRMLADDPEALEAIGASYGLTRERVRQVEAKALHKLRAHFRRYATAEDRETLDIAARSGTPVRVKAWFDPAKAPPVMLNARASQEPMTPLDETA